MQNVLKLFGDVKPMVVCQTADSLFSIITKLANLDVEFDETSFYTLRFTYTGDDNVPDEVQATVNDLEPLRPFLSHVAYGLLEKHAEILRDCYGEAIEEDNRLEDLKRKARK